MQKVGRFQWCHKSSKKRCPHIIPLWSSLSSGSSAFLTVTLLQEGFPPPPSGHKIRRVMLRSIYIGLILQEHFIIFSIFFVGGAELSLSCREGLIRGHLSFLVRGEHGTKSLSFRLVAANRPIVALILFIGKVSDTW